MPLHDVVSSHTLQATTLLHPFEHLTLPKKFLWSSLVYNWQSKDEDPPTLIFVVIFGFFVIYFLVEIRDEAPPSAFL